MKDFRFNFKTGKFANLVEEKKDKFEESLSSLAEEMEEDPVRMYSLAYSMLKRQYAGKFIPLECFDIRERMNNNQVYRLAKICRIFSCELDEISRQCGTDSLSLFTEYVYGNFS